MADDGPPGGRRGGTPVSKGRMGGRGQVCLLMAAAAPTAASPSVLGHHGSPGIVFLFLPLKVLSFPPIKV